MADKLPTELWTNILHQLHVSFRQNVCKYVCRRWFNICQSLVHNIKVFHTKVLTKYPNIKEVEISEGCQLDIDACKKVKLDKLIIMHKAYPKIIKYTKPREVKLNLDNIVDMTDYDSDDSDDVYLRRTTRRKVLEYINTCTTVELYGVCANELVDLKVPNIIWHDNHHHNLVDFENNTHIRTLKICGTDCTITKVPNLKSFISHGTATLDDKSMSKLDILKMTAGTIDKFPNVSVLSY